MQCAAVAAQNDVIHSEEINMRVSYKKHQLEITLQVLDRVGFELINVEQGASIETNKSDVRVIIGSLTIKSMMHSMEQFFALGNEGGSYEIISGFPISIGVGNKIIIDNDFIEEANMLLEGYADHLVLLTEGLNHVFSKLINSPV